MHNDGKKWFIFRHLGSFLKFYCKNEQEANLLLLGKRPKDSYYYTLVSEQDTKAKVKEYIKATKSQPYRDLKDEHDS